MRYIIYDENKEAMRSVSRKEEAQELIRMRPGWTIVIVKEKRKVQDFSKFEPALM